MAKAFPESYKDPLYAQLDAQFENKHGLPVGMVSAIRTAGERTNASQVSSAGAKSPYQFIPATRDAVLKKYGIDPWLSPETASEATALLLKESLKRNQGDPEKAVREYHGGTNPKNWGPVNDAYWKRVGPALTQAKLSGLEAGFSDFVAKQKPQDQMSSGFDQWLKNRDMVSQIPGMDGNPVNLPPEKPKQEPGLVDKLIGTGEAALSTVTGMTGGAVGLAAGTAKGITEAILDGSFGTREAADLVEQKALGAAGALTYQPRTQSGQQQTEAVGEVMQQLIPVMPLAGQMGMAGSVARPAVRAAGDAARAGVAKAGQVAAPAAARVKQTVQSVMPGSERPTPGTGASIGAAGTDMATMRRANAEQLGFTGNAALTRGQATRDAAQLKFEVETAKMPEAGVPLRERVTAQNNRILNNFDQWVDQTGAEAPTLRAVGTVVDRVLVEQAARDKTRIRVAYKAAEKAGEMESPVTLDGVVRHLNESAPDAATAPLLDVARARAVKLGIAADDGTGTLIAQPVPLKIAETYRQAVSRATDYEPTNIRQSTIIKGLVDESTDGMGGNLYKEARGLRTRFAQNYENRATISKLLNNKRGTSDRQVALEDVFDHTIMKGSLDDVRNVRRVLQRGGADGQQAWRELQGSTVNWIKDQATKNVATDATGNRVISPAALDKAIRTLDADGKLDFVFGKQGAQRMRDLNELAKYVKTVPPEAAINTSNTVSTLLAAFGDIGMSGIAGAPVPLVTMTRVIRQYVKDRALRRRIEDALYDAQRKRTPGAQRPPISEPPTEQRTLH